MNQIDLEPHEYREHVRYPIIPLKLTIGCAVIAVLFALSAMFVDQARTPGVIGAMMASFLCGIGIVGRFPDYWLTAID